MTTLAVLDEVHPALRASYRDQLIHEAESICIRKLIRDRHDPATLNLRGLLALRRGDPELAAIYLRRATEIDELNPTYASDFGDALSQCGRHAEAERAYRHALQLAPADTSRLCALALALQRQGRIAEAISCLLAAAERDPASAATHRHLGDAFSAQAQLRDAAIAYERCIQLDTSDTEAFAQLGRIQLQLDDPAGALATFRQGLQVRARAADLHTGAGDALLRLGRVDAAIEAYRAALSQTPRHLRACRQLAITLSSFRSPAEATHAWDALGTALARKGRLEEAVVAYREALRCKPDQVNARVGLGFVLLDLRRAPAAITEFEAALRLEPNHAAAHQGLASASAATGDLPRSWEETAWFDQHGPWMRRHFEQPLWDGSSLTSRTILLWTHTGPADAIQLIRFVQRVKAQGARVLVECDSLLMALFQRSPYVDEVVQARMPPGRFDVQAPLAWLPRVLETQLETIPADTPYLTADRATVQTWRNRIASSGEPTIGLDLTTGWSSHLDLRQLAVLENLPGVRFFSLARDHGALDLAIALPTLPIERLLDASSTADDIAALIMNLDLVITCDSWIAHLSGALAKPVWVLLPFAADARWMLHGGSTPWYPTMRLFRQSRPGWWGDVFKDLRCALEAQPFLRQVAG